MTEHKVAIGLGSNLGDRAGNIRRAATALAAAGLSSVQLSSLHRTAPVDCRPGAPDFLNAALVATTRLAPLALLRVCREIETDAGRQSERQAGPPYENRAIDLDVLLIDDIVLATADLVVPHPRLTARVFVLAPLAELAPDWVVPPGGRTVREWLEEREESP